MATGGSAPNFTAGSIATLINRLMKVQLNEVSRKIEALEGRLATDVNTGRTIKYKQSIQLSNAIQHLKW